MNASSSGLIDYLVRRTARAVRATVNVAIAMATTPIAVAPHPMSERAESGPLPGAARPCPGPGVALARTGVGEGRGAGDDDIVGEDRTAGIDELVPLACALVTPYPPWETMTSQTPMAAPMSRSRPFIRLPVV
jgi:hypothetical protein